MKKFATKQNLKSCLRTTFLVALFACLLLGLVACNNAAPEEYIDKGLTLSGQIVSTSGALANVSVLKNGEDFLPSVYTNASGIFLAHGLEQGDVISFQRFGYTFLPSTFTVNEDYFELKVYASVVAGEDSDIPNNTDEKDSQTLSFSLISNNMALVENISGIYDKDSVISLTARQSDGWRFEGWYQSNCLLSGGEALHLDFTITNNATIEARFVAVPFMPTELAWSETTDTLSWNACKGATSYKVYINNNLCANTEKTSLNLSNYLDGGDNNVSVEAVGDATFDGRSSSKNNVAIFFKNRISSAKNIGFLQNDDGKFFVFSLNSAFCTDCYGFAFMLQKNDAIWSGEVSTAAIAVSPSQTNLSLSIEENGAATGEQSLSVTASRLEVQNINGESYQTIKIGFDEVLTTTLPFLLNSYYENLILNPESYSASLSSIFETGDYTFTITATTSCDTERNSLPVSATYSYTKRLDAPSHIELDTTSPESLVLTFVDSNNSSLYGNPASNDLLFELYFNDVKVDTICSSKCALPEAQQTATATYAIDLDKLTLQFLPDLPNLQTISLRTTAVGYLSSDSTTLTVIF